MEAKQVIDKILTDAQNEADSIMKKAEKNAERQKKQLQDQLNEFNEETEKEASEAADDKKQNMLAAARMKNAKELLAEKRAILNEVFDKASEKLKQMSEDEYKNMMKNLMLKAVETGDEEVILDKKEKIIDQSFIKSVNRELGPGYQGNLKLSDDKMDLGGGGFILKRGLIQNNVSYNVLIQQAKDDLEMDLAKDLFKS